MDLDQPMVCIYENCRYGMDEEKTFRQVIEHQINVHVSKIYCCQQGHLGDGEPPPTCPLCGGTITRRMP